MMLFIFAATLSALCQPTRPIASVRASTIDTVASHAASAIRQGRAHVEPNFLSSPRVPAAVLGSRAAVTLPKGLDDTELAAALAPHRDVAILEIDDVADR